ncbi:OmpW family protein [Sphingomonas parva]|uniref:OmpW family protein n=1 Tax=Sphingomonas parva TaxID=2555898 RepID=A0A4Y8ZPG3_9SPHN|nr:OmpW family outer membrane protein [Sphingomonas parva]TFI57132.1 OmpW family protein [Sphingomonas parva]
MKARYRCGQQAEHQFKAPALDPTPRDEQKAILMSITASLLTLAAGAAVAAPSPAAQMVEHDAFARAGVARLKLADKGGFEIDGTLVPGAGYSTPEKWMGSFELGYFVTRSIALQVSGTTPVKTPNMPNGTLDGTPNLGTDKFSLFTGTASWHPLRGGKISPYVGGGIEWFHVWSIRDEFADNLNVRDEVGPAIQVGAEINVTERFGVYVDAKKAFVKTSASAEIGPSVVTAKPGLDPFIIQAGVVVRF